MIRYNSSLAVGFVLLLFGLCAPLTASAQQPTRYRYAMASVFNAATQLPIGQFLSTPVHLGGTAGAEFRYNNHPANQWFQTAKLGFSYHQYVQSTIQLYSEAGYRRAIWKGTAAEFRLGAGYLHAIPATEIFTLKEGQYKRKTNFGRPQVMAGAALGLSYTQQNATHPLRFFLDYQFYLQMPFVKSYVPLLPNTLLHLGVGVPFTIFKP
ncbi:MAG: hypothetical protein IT261_03365 [Saprospiraceae bacterium]|nr:hypothetical protein [Saprospiraceae bacterium]